MLCVRAVTPARVCALSLARLCAPLFVRVRARSLVCARAPSAWYLYLYLRTDGPAAPRDQTRASPAAQGRKASKRHRARATLAHALALLLPYSQSGSEAGFQIPAREIALGGDPPPPPHHLFYFNSGVSVYNKCLASKSLQLYNNLVLYIFTAVSAVPRQ